MLRFRSVPFDLRLLFFAAYFSPRTRAKFFFLSLALLYVIYRDNFIVQHTLTLSAPLLLLLLRWFSFSSLPFLLIKAANTGKYKAMRNGQMGNEIGLLSPSDGRRSAMAGREHDRDLIDGNLPIDRIK